MVDSLALDLVSTIRHDGTGGVTDDLTTPAALTDWVRARAAHLDTGADEFDADEAALAAVLALRQAARSLFAHAVRPAAPSRADAHRLLELSKAVDRVNTAAARVPTVIRMRWSDASPAARLVPTAPVEPTARLTAALARAVIGLLTGPNGGDLRACPAPRCVRYFIRTHGRQEFCKPSCGNRSRAARHYHRHRVG